MKVQCVYITVEGDQSTVTIWFKFLLWFEFHSFLPWFPQASSHCGLMKGLIFSEVALAQWYSLSNSNWICAPLPRKILEPSLHKIKNKNEIWLHRIILIYLSILWQSLNYETISTMEFINMERSKFLTLLKAY